MLHRLAVCLNCCRVCKVHRMRDGCIQPLLTCRLREHAQERGRPPSRSGAGCWWAACSRETPASILQQHGLQLAVQWLTCDGALCHRPGHAKGPLPERAGTRCETFCDVKLQRAPMAAADLWWDVASLLATPPAVPRAPAAVAGGQAQPLPAPPLPCHCWKGLTPCPAPPACRGSPARMACSRGVTALMSLSRQILGMFMVRKEGGACRIRPTVVDASTQCCMSWVCLAGPPAADSTTKPLKNVRYLRKLHHVPDNCVTRWCTVKQLGHNRHPAG